MSVNGPPPDERTLRRWLRDRKRAMERQSKRGGVQQSLVDELGSTSEALWNDERYGEALDTIDLALEAVRGMRDRDVRLELSYKAWKDRAFIATRLGLFRETVKAYRRAISFGDRGPYENEHPQSGPGDTRELASTHFRVGNYEESLFLLGEAEGRLRRYEPLLSQPVREDEAARISAARSLVYLDLGEYKAAEACAEEAVGLHGALARDPSLGLKRLWRVLQTAIAYVHQGNARRELARERESGFEGAHEAYANSFGMLADDELRGLVASGDDRVLAVEARDRRADVHLERGRTSLLEAEYGKANIDVERALSLTSQSNLLMHAAVHHLYLGQARAGLGMSSQAEASFAEAVRLGELHGTPEIAWRALRELAKLLRATGRHQEATDTLRRCVAAIEGLRRQDLPEATKVSMLAVKEGAYEDIVLDLCGYQDGGEREAAPEVNKEAFGYAEGAKSRVFAERLGATELPATGVPAKLLERERKLHRELRDCRAGSREAYYTGAGAAPGARDRAVQVAKIEERLGKARTRIAKSGRAGEEYVTLRRGDPLDYDGARRLLSEAAGEGGGGNPASAAREAGKVVLVDYFVTSEEVLIFVGRADLEVPVVRRVRIAREILSDWAFDIENTDADDLSAWDLARWQAELGPLVEPLEEWSEEDDTVWIVPHAELHLLPLHALKVGGRYLADRNPVVYSPSVSVMPYCKAKRNSAERGAVVLGDSLPPPNNLEHARREAVAVATLFGEEPLLGERASRHALEEKLRRPGGPLRALHVACHGDFDRTNPLRSRIRLAPTEDEEAGNGSPDLNAEEVLGLDVRAGLVVLSACTSGVSGRRGGDELIGLTRSFMYAGASSVIVGLWYVADASTKLLMERFYEFWLGELGGEGAASSRAEALRLAQRSVMGAEGFGHPYFWSPFVLAGDWR